MANMHQLLKAMIEKGASDLHLTTGTPPQLRIDGKLHGLKMPPLSPQDTKQLCYSVLTDAQKHRFEESNELDLSFSVQRLSRFRGNLFVQRGNVAGAFRAIPFKILTFEQLNLPQIVADLANKKSGLILVTGSTGSGKSTTLASVINKINEERHEHIITIEDPIEYLHAHKGCIVNQREVGADTEGFKQALRYILRQDPDVVLIGELRDLETISLAMTAAETGHFVLATLHTNNAVRTINRMIGAFPSNQQGQVRTMLSESLRAVISQRLVPRADETGRVAALELLVINKAIGNMVRDEKTIQIRSSIQTGSAHGMMLLEQSLNELVAAGTITREAALELAEEKKLITAGA